MTFEKAVRTQAKLRVAIEGPAKSGKTFTALMLATAAVERFGGRIAFVDTERGSARKYAPKPGETADGKLTFDFDVMEFETFSPKKFIEAIEAASKGGYTVLIADSLSHEWMGTGGVLQMVEATPDKNRYAAWRTPSMLHTKLIDTMLQSGLHVIATMRSKMAYDQVKNETTGKTEIVKLGLQPVQREGMEYEFDVVFSMDVENNCRVTGSRCPEMPNGTSENKPAEPFFAPLLDWVSEGAEPAPKLKPESTSQKKPAIVAGKSREKWAAFLQEAALPDVEALGALGTETVAEWTKLHNSDLDGAIAEIKKLLNL